MGPIDLGKQEAYTAVGGTGSGRWTYHNKKETVEKCWSISITQVTRIIDLEDPQAVPRFLRPTMPKTDKRMSPVRCASSIGENGTLKLILSYTVKDRWGLEGQVKETIHLRTTQPNFGGVRWWFACPHTADGEHCGRRVGKLYRFPDQRRFACRHCLDLTYESCQKSHRYDGLFGRIAHDVPGLPYEVIESTLCPPGKAASRVAGGGSLLDAFEKAFVDMASRSGSPKAERLANKLGSRP